LLLYSTVAAAVSVPMAKEMTSEKANRRADKLKDWMLFMETVSSLTFLIPAFFALEFERLMDKP
jgi:hypothetical protein